MEVKKKYLIKFYYDGDLRYKTTVDAYSELEALILVQSSDMNGSLRNWCDNAIGFKILITLNPPEYIK